MTITEPAPAKINLALHIRRKRPDGYHDLETLFAFARDGDVVTVSEGERNSLTITGPFAALLAHPHPSAATPLPPSPDGRGKGPAVAGGGKGEGEWIDNLVTRAAEVFRATFTCPPVGITLEKSLPVASGIGGGSADAAATLRALARLTGVDPEHSRLFAIAAQLGADVPACLLGRTAYATGRGDNLTPLPDLGNLPMLLVNPGVPLSTAAMFASWDGVDRGPLAGNGTPLDRARAGRNDFTAPAVRHAPAVAQVLDLLEIAPGSTFARLSGSGATCFALFANATGRDSAAASARARGWWALPTLVR